MSASKIKLGIFGLVVVGVAVALFTLPIKSYLASFGTWVETYPVLGPVLLGLAYVVATVLFVPGLVLTIAAGSAFGVLKGFVVVSIGSVAGASIAFLLGRTLLRDWVTAKVENNPKFKAIDQAIGKNAFKVIMLIRLSPVFPFNLVNYMFGLTKASFKDHLLASWIGMIPGTFLYVGIGAGLGGVFTEDGLGPKIMWGVGILAALGVTAFITRLAKKALDEAVAENQNPTAEPTPQEA